MAFLWSTMKEYRCCCTVVSVSVIRCSECLWRTPSWTARAGARVCVNDVMMAMMMVEIYKYRIITFSVLK